DSDAAINAGDCNWSAARADLCAGDHFLIYLQWRDIRDIHINAAGDYSDIQFSIDDICEIELGPAIDTSHEDSAFAQMRDGYIQSAMDARRFRRAFEVGNLSPTIHPDQLGRPLDFTDLDAAVNLFDA